MEALWARLDLAATLALVGLPVTPVNPDRLASVERDLLGEWAQDWADRHKKAQERARAK